jgi:hypothetical protein
MQASAGTEPLTSVMTGPSGPVITVVSVVSSPPRNSPEHTMTHTSQEQRESISQAPAGFSTVDITRLLTTAEVMVGPVLIARILARRTGRGSGLEADVSARRDL